MSISGSLGSLLALLPWAGLWGLGGLGLARTAFRLRTAETLLVGIAAGWVLQTWLANLLVRVFPLTGAFWLSAGLVFLAGGILWMRVERPWLSRIRSGHKADVSWGWVGWLVGLAALSMVYFSINRGLAIFDDFAHLPTISLMAAGDIPPHFPLDPQVLMRYHYFLLLFSAQAMHIAELSPWVALDFGRAWAFALAVLLSAQFARRLTHAWWGGLWGGLVVAFGSGARWLLLLLPYDVVKGLSHAVTTLGSASSTGTTLADALVKPWAVDGAGPMGFPFAFANGIYPAGVVVGLTVNGLAGYVVLLVLLLTSTRWNVSRLAQWTAALLSAVLIATWGLLGEAELVGIGLGWVVVAVGYALAKHTLRLPRSLWIWLGVVGAGGLAGVLEGGALTEVLENLLRRLSGAAPLASYQTVGFTLAWPPAVVSSHLGVLPLMTPATLLVALLEIGPLLLCIPLLAAWGWKAFRLRRWYEAATAAGALGMLFTVFLQFSGSTGVRNTPRLYVFLPVLAVFATPLVGLWCARRTALVKGVAAGAGLVLIFGGLAMASVELLAAQRPVYSTFLTNLDVRMYHVYWNKLPRDTMVFDSYPNRAVTVFARPADSAFTWYAEKPAWKALRKNPDPAALLSAGYRYVYLDAAYWKEISPLERQKLQDACIRQLDEFSDAQGDFRRLLDLQACR